MKENRIDYKETQYTQEFNDEKITFFLSFRVVLSRIHIFILKFTYNIDVRVC